MDVYINIRLEFLEDTGNGPGLSGNEETAVVAVICSFAIQEICYFCLILVFNSKVEVRIVVPVLVISRDTINDAAVVILRPFTSIAVIVPRRLGICRKLDVRWKPGLVSITSRIPFFLIE